MRISDWSSDVCSSDLDAEFRAIFRNEHHCVASPQPIGAQPFGQCCHLPRRFLPAQGMPLPLALPPQKGCIPLFGGAGEEHGHQIRRSEEHTSELQSLMRISYAVFCLKKKKRNYIT